MTEPKARDDANTSIVRVLLSLAANLDWLLQQLDVKNASVKGDLEEVYMELPLGFDEASRDENVCILRKSLYGLKQSPRTEFGRFTRVIRQLGYQQAQTDHRCTTNIRVVRL